MSYNSKLPMDDEYIAAGPADIRENLRALKEDQIVDAGTLAGLPVGNASGNIPESNGVINKNLNADLLDGYEASAFATTSHNHSAVTASTAGFMNAADKTKLDGIAAGAQVNQNSFGNLVIGDTTIQADSATDTLTLTPGANISLTPDATNDAITIAVSGTVPSAATAITCSGNAATATKWANARTLSFTGDATGAMSVDGSATANAELTLKPTGVTAGTYRNVTVDAQGRVIAGANPTSEDIDITGNAASASAVAWSNITGKPSTYTLPVATASTIGGVKGGSNVSIASDGTLSVSIPSTFNYTTTNAYTGSTHRTGFSVPVTNCSSWATSEGDGSSGSTTGRSVIASGVPAGTYSLQSIIQQLVNRSHDHNYTIKNTNCNCCSCGGE